METKVETRTAPCPLAQTPRSPEVSRPFNAANGYSIEIVILTRDRECACESPNAYYNRIAIAFAIFDIGFAIADGI